MTASDELLQKRLEQLEAGVPLESCLVDLPEEEAELLRLVAALREAPHPRRDPEAVAAQRAQVVRLAGLLNRRASQSPQHTLKAALGSLRESLTPRTAFAGGVAVLAVCALIVWVAMSAFGRPTGDTDQAPLVRSTAESLAQEPSPGGAQESKYEAFVPYVLASAGLTPVRALLQDPLGVVQVRADDGTWMAAGARRLVVAGERVRTGPLSSVRLAFFDGSQVRLGSDTEVSVEELDARRSDGPRIVVLRQWSGETDHWVAQASNPNSKYAVLTPSAMGSAKGTAFQVWIAPGKLTGFSVDDGVVTVSGEDVTVDVVAGQATTVSAEQPPAAPAFRISGEGQVTQTGDTWIIAGQLFETHDATLVVGDPHVGDWVTVAGRLYADGTRVADRIALLWRSPAHSFSIVGRVEGIGETEWTVAGQPIQVDDETVIDDEIGDGDLVRVEGIILEDGELLAELIHLVEEAPGPPFYFIGVVQELGEKTWTISGLIVAINAQTDVDEDLEVGDVVKVRGWVLDNGEWLARAIERARAVERAFEFTGVVQNIDPWEVSGIFFETRAWTEIDPAIKAGDLVRVKGRILENGTWVASEIERLDEEERGLTILFVGTADNIGSSTWVVSGIPLQVGEETVIVGDIKEGDLVKVTARILPDGVWLATRIELLEFDQGGLGCVYITAVVVGMGPGRVELSNWPPIDLGDVIVEGEIHVGSVLLILVCVDEEGAIEIVHIIVIYQPESEEPLPPPSPPMDGQDKVTICHKPNSKNPHSITIARPALQAHLNHGDTRGPCK